MRTRRGRLARLASVLAINAAVAGVLLLAGEALVRVAAPGVVPAGADASLFRLRPPAGGPGAMWTLRPGAQGVSYGVRVGVGPRATWAYAADTDADTLAWLLVGDSVTMGLGVEPDTTFAGRLAALSGVRIDNPSVLGWAASDYRRAVGAHLAEGGRPAAVTLVWCLNDLYPDGQPIPVAAAAEQTAAAPDAPLGARVYQTVRRRAATPLAWLGRHSRLYRWVRTVPTGAVRRTYAYDRALYTDAARQPDRDRAFAALAAVRDTLRARRIPFSVALVPEAPQIAALAADTAPQDTLRARLAGLGIRAVDLAPALRRAGGRLFLTGDATHLSAAGHAVVARALQPLAPRSETRPGGTATR